MSSRVSGVSLTDVRTFAGEQRVQLSKVNLLVGENSVGKTTLLGCVNGLARLASLEGLDDRVNCFGQAPFDMVSFETIARSGCTSFLVGLELDGGPWREFAVEFARGPGGSLSERRLTLVLAGIGSGSGATLRICRESVRGGERWIFNGPGFEFRLDQADVSDRQFTTWLSRSIRYGLLPFGGNTTLFRKRVLDATDRDFAEYGKFVNFFRHRFLIPRTPFDVKSIEPRGLERRRSYRVNPLQEPDLPLDLDALANAGRELGLFNRIELHEIGEKFEVLIDVSGSLHNIFDVGYGVSSLLPFLNALVSAAPETLFLLQQPEVHLHPSAQAQLVRTIAKSGHAFIVETHSDHVIDWLRILVKEGELDHSDVAIIYFETTPDDVSASRLHQITLDGRANLAGQPRGYREFFSDETARLLGLPS